MKSEKSSALGRAPRVRFSISPAHIENGVTRNSNHCMVAEALKDAYPELQYVAVDIQTIRASDPKKGERYVWMTPRQIQELIVNFDRGIKPQPFSCELRTGQCVEFGKNRQGQKAYRERQKKTAVSAAAKKRQPNAKFSKPAKNNGLIPQVIGGKTPPKSVGQRRQFGLRSLQF